MTYQTQSNGWTAVEINSGAQTRTGKPIGTGNPILKDIRSARRSRSASTATSWSPRCSAATASSGARLPAAGLPAVLLEPDVTTSALDFDPDRANQMLDEAGYPMGSDGIREDPDTGKKFEFRLGIHSDDATDAAIAPYLEEWMKDIGIKLEDQAMSFDQLNNNLAKGDWDLLMDGWSTGPDPTYLLSASRPAPRFRWTTGRTATPTRSSATRSTTSCSTSRSPSSTPTSARTRSHQMQEILYARQRRPDPVLQERAVGAPQRPGEELPVR